MGLTLIASLSAANGRVWADDNDDKPEPAPKAKFGRGPGLMDRLFMPSPKPAEKKSAKKDADKKPKDKAEKPAPEGPTAVRAREQAAFERRSQVCLRLMDLANQQNDMELYRRAEELEQRAWAVYIQRTAHLPISNLAVDTDEQILDRHLGDKKTTAKSAKDLKAGTAKVKDGDSQAAVREVKP
jgi:hypothetical protein